MALPIPLARAASRWRNSLNGINEPPKRANGAGRSRQNQRHQPRQNRRPRRQRRALQRTTRPPQRNHAAHPPPPGANNPTLPAKPPTPPVRPQPPATIHVRLPPGRSHRNGRPSSRNGRRLLNHNAKTRRNGRPRGAQRHNSDRSAPPLRPGVDNNRPNPMPGNPDPAIISPPARETPGSNNAAKPPVSPGVDSIAAASSPGNNNHGCSATSKPPRRRHVNNPTVNNPARVPPTPAIGRQARLAPQRQVVPIRRLPRLPKPAPGGAPPVRLGIRPIASRPSSHRNAPNVPSAPGSQPSAGLQPPTNPRVVGPLPRAMGPEAVDRIDKTHGRIITIHKNPRVAPHPSPGCAAAGHSTMTYIADTSNRRFVLSFKRT